MAFPLLAAFGIAKLLAPRIGHLLGGKEGEAIAQNLTETALEISGENDADTLHQKLLNDPGFLREMNRQFQELEIHILMEESARLSFINQSMQVEAQSNDAYVRRWRPTYGYLTAIAWFAMMAGSSAAIFWAVVKDPEQAPVIITAMGTALAQSSMLWGIALAVLGVSVHCRSKDKLGTNSRPNPTSDLFEKLGSILPKS
ncbi:MAG: 3TM-type holin [Sphingomonadales bacterium]|jgi:hypothetical protein